MRRLISNAPINVVAHYPPYWADYEDYMGGGGGGGGGGGLTEEGAPVIGSLSTSESDCIVKPCVSNLFHHFEGGPGQGLPYYESN